MADERIVLSYDPTDAIAGAAKANKAIEANEKTAEQAGLAIVKATEKHATSIVSITERSQASVNNIVRSAERKAAIASGGPGGKLAFERSLDLKRVAGDPEAINRVTAAYDKLALAQGKAASGGQSMKDSLLGLAAQFGIVLGAAELLKKAFSAGLDATLYAARTEQLGGALRAVAKANGIAESTTHSLEAQLKQTGIVTQDARSSLARLIAAQVDHTKAVQLARAAQDLGRVAGIASSEAFEKLTHAIVTQQPELLRFLGLNVNLQREFERFAKTAGRSAESLSEFEKRQITTNAVLVAAKGYSGVYADSLDTVGGKLISLKRYALEAKGAFGDEFLPVLGQAVGLLTMLGKSGEDFGGKLAVAVKIGVAPFTAALSDMIEKYKEIKELNDPDFVKNQRLTMEAAGMKVRNQQLIEGTIGPIRAEEEMQAKRMLALLEVQKKAKEEVERKSKAAAEKAEAEFKKNEQAAFKFLSIRKAGGFNLDEIKDLPKPFTDFYDSQFKAAQKLSEDTMEMELSNIKEQFAQEEIFAQTSRDKQMAAAEGFNARTVEQKIAVEEQKAGIEREYLLKTYAIKAQLLEADQQMELAKAAENAELKNAINQKYALAGRELTLKTEAAIAATGQEAAIKSAQIVADANQKNFDAIKHSAETLFDALITRTRSFGDVLKTLLMQAVLTPLKEIASTAIATTLTGGRGAGSSAGGLGGLLGGLLGTGGISRAGAPGGTGGFAGPVGMSGMLGIGGTAGGFGGFGGGAGGILTQLGQIGATNKLFQSGVYGAKGGAMLGIGGGLAFDGLRRGGLIGLGETTAGGALIGAKFGGPIGGLIGGGIGAIAGTIRLFMKSGEDKMVSKIKAVYGIDIDRGFAKNPLMGIIKDQFGGDIDMGIRSPIVRELLAAYRMQSNQAGMGSGFGAMNNTARGVSLSGYGGGVYQNPVSVSGGSYGYGGSLPSTGASQPFQDQRPIVIENRLQIDGRDVVASVQRTNQASNGRRESATMLMEPLSIFG